MLTRSLKFAAALVRRVSKRPHRLGDKVSIGAGTNFTVEQVVVRDPNGCVVRVGSQSNIHANVVLEQANASVVIGSRTHIGGGSLVDAATSIDIGDDVLIAMNVTIMDHDSHSLRFSERRDDVVQWMHGRKDWSNVRVGPVRIGNKSWIGTRAIILRGVDIGEGAIVGAGSVVTRSVEPWTVVAGNPARIIRRLSEGER